MQFTLLAAFAALLWPLRNLARRRALYGRGWVELTIAGEITEFRRDEVIQELLRRRLLQQKEPRRVVLDRLHQLVDELVADTHAKGVLVRLGPVTGGWASADAVRQALLRLRDGGKYVVLHIERVAGNREMLIASAADRLLMPPTATIAAGGTAAPGLYFKALLNRAGFTAEVASAGRYKSAPDQFTRTTRSSADHEQTKAIVDTLDHFLIEAMQVTGRMDGSRARSLLESAPMVGIRAKQLEWIDGLAHDEDLAQATPSSGENTSSKAPLPASRYLQIRTLSNPFEPRRRQIGIVKIVGNILDEGPPQNFGNAELAVEHRVVADLRASLEDQNIAAVVLVINSRGGSVTASDAIWSAIKRLNHEKPVIAYLSDVAASGGYYVACGARAIVGSPLTITGSIGVFSVVPTWRTLSERLGIGQDVIKNLPNADMYNPWMGFDETRRAHAQQEVEIMYETFLERVAEARNITRDAAHDVAQGRVWIGQDAHDAGLLDGLGGIQEAIERARSLVSGEQLAPRPIVVRSKKFQRRPQPARTEGAVSPADFLKLFTAPSPSATILTQELLSLWLTQPPHAAPVWAWAPVVFD
ncbi:MAG: signal peptide peptidase SppA [Myxococcales bacterium]|nr:signal peptide peptidase SppA [Myxococcales bacterium]